MRAIYKKPIPPSFAKIKTKVNARLGTRVDALVEDETKYLSTISLKYLLRRFREDKLHLGMFGTVGKLEIS